MQNQILQGDYTSLGGSFQLCLPLNFEFQIPKDDPVRLLRHFVDAMDLSALYQTFSQANKNRVQPRQMFAILIYAYLNGIYSSLKQNNAKTRRSVTACFLYCFLCHDYRQCQMTVIEVKENGAVARKCFRATAPFLFSRDFVLHLFSFRIGGLYHE